MFLSDIFLCMKTYINSASQILLLQCFAFYYVLLLLYQLHILHLLFLSSMGVWFQKVLSYKLRLQRFCGKMCRSVYVALWLLVAILLVADLILLFLAWWKSGNFGWKCHGCNDNWWDWWNCATIWKEVLSYTFFCYVKVFEIYIPSLKFICAGAGDVS